MRVLSAVLGQSRHHYLQLLLPEVDKQLTSVVNDTPNGELLLDPSQHIVRSMYT